MRILLLILFYLSLVGCSSTRNIKYGNEDYTLFVSGENRYTFNDTTGICIKDTLINILYPNGQIYETKNIAVDNYNKVSTLKNGKWELFYPNGQIHVQGNYGVGKHRQCCTDGLCMTFYNYKKDHWIFWYENGTKKAEGDFCVSINHVQTSCQGGTTKKTGEIYEKQWAFWNYDGVKINPTDSLIKSYEKFKTEKEY